MDAGRYLVADSRHMPLARAVMESPQDAPNWQIRILEGEAEKVLDHEMVELISLGDNGTTLVGRIVRHRDDRFVLEPVGQLGEEIRENLRMPVRFHSFIYPVEGKWRGRRPIVAHDVSCGGMAFFCEEHLENGERVEVVVPVNKEPLVLQAEILRPRLSSRQIPLYATKFIDLIHDEEVLVREAVFSIQLQNRDSGKGAVVS